MNWIFWAITAAGVLHIGEEHLFPGGFLAALRQVNPRLGSSLTPGLAVVLNSLFLLLSVVCALIAPRWLGFTLSVAGLVFWNALLHLGATIKLRRYVPGTVTAVVLYLPLSILAYKTSAASGALTTGEFVASVALGLAWNLVPAGTLAILGRTRAPVV